MSHRDTEITICYNTISTLVSMHKVAKNKGVTAIKEGLHDYMEYVNNPNFFEI